MFYLINLFLLVLYYFLIVGNDINSCEKRKIFAILSCVHIVLFRALADPYNYVDTRGYAYAFDYIRTLNFQEAVLGFNQYTSWGRGYIAINWVVGQFSSNAQWFFAIVASLSLIPVMWYHYKVSHSMLVSLIIFLTYPMMYYMGFGVIRQHLSIGIMLLALYYISDYKISFPLAIVSALCHTTGVIFFPFYLFRMITYRNFSIVNIVLVVITSIISAILLKTSLIALLVRNDEIGQSLEEGGNTLPLIVMGSMFILMVFLDVYKYLDKGYERDAFLFLSYGLVLAAIGVGISGFGRLSLCSMYIVPICLSLTYKYVKGDKKILVTIYNIVLFALIIYLINHSGKSFNYVPFW